MESLDIDNASMEEKNCGYPQKIYKMNIRNWLETNTIDLIQLYGKITLG